MDTFNLLCVNRQAKEDILLVKKIYIPLFLCLFIIFAIGLLSLRSSIPETPVTVYKTVTPTKTSNAQEIKSSTGQQNCCTNGETQCCQTSGSALSQKADESAPETSVSDKKTLPVAAISTDSTGDTLPPSSESRVVPAEVVQEANRFKDWEKRENAHTEAWAAHNRIVDQNNVEIDRQFVSFLMAIPIEERRTTFEQLEHQLKSEVPEYWDVYSAKLFYYGLDFQTEHSPEESKALLQQSIERLATLNEQGLEQTKRSIEFLEAARVLSRESDDF